jgi:hypothetical protein
MTAFANAQRSGNRKDKARVNQAFKQLQGAGDRIKQDVFHLCDLRGLEDAVATLADLPAIQWPDLPLAAVPVDADFLALLDGSVFLTQDDLDECNDVFLGPETRAVPVTLLTFEYPM